MRSTSPSTVAQLLSRTALAALMGVATLAAAPAQAASPAAAPASAPAAIDPAKKPLIDKILTLWHPETVVMVMVQRPAADAVQQSRIALQGRVAAERQDATMKEIAGDAQRYVDEVTPLAQAAAARQLPVTVGAMLAENFSVDELRQLIAMLESPVKKKFEQLVPGMEKRLGEGVAADAGPAINPKLDAMKQSVAGRLRAAALVR